MRTALPEPSVMAVPMFTLFSKKATVCPDKLSLRWAVKAIVSPAVKEVELEFRSKVAFGETVV